MVASTLLPTALHLFVVVISFTTLFSQKAYEWLLTQFDVTDGGPPIVATVGLALFLGAWVLFPTVPLYGIGVLAVEVAEPLRFGYVDLLEWIVRNTGAL